MLAAVIFTKKIRNEIKASYERNKNIEYFPLSKTNATFEILGTTYSFGEKADDFIADIGSTSVKVLGDVIYSKMDTGKLKMSLQSLGLYVVMIISYVKNLESNLDSKIAFGKDFFENEMKNDPTLNQKKINKSLVSLQELNILKIYTRDQWEKL